MSKIFGVGWAKTGTTTLGQCFQILGYDHQTQDLALVKDVELGDFSRIVNCVEQHETFEDWPWIILYRELDEAFPGSRFVLTKRDTDQWIQSYKNMLLNLGDASEELNEIRRILYGLPFPEVTELELMERYEAHNVAVESYFADRPDDLLIVDWGQGDGWTPLCDFLGVEVPVVPFPHENQGKYRKRSMLDRLKQLFSSS